MLPPRAPRGLAAGPAAKGRPAHSAWEGTARAPRLGAPGGLELILQAQAALGVAVAVVALLMGDIG